MTEKPAELDYALLAQWARVNADGTLTVVDGSFLRVRAPRGSHIPLAVAGRIRFFGEPYQTSITVTLELAGGVSTSFTTMAEAPEDSEYGEGRRHVLFAFNTQVPALDPGRCLVRVAVGDGGPSRDLYFTIEEA